MNIRDLKLPEITPEHVQYFARNNKMTHSKAERYLELQQLLEASYQAQEKQDTELTSEVLHSLITLIVDKGVLL